MAHIEVRRYAACPFSAAIELAERVTDRLNALYLSPFPPLGERVVFAAASTPDESDQARLHDALLIAWRPRTSGLFPNFHGVLTVRPKHAGVWLQLSGDYDPPYAAAGKAFDFVAGRLVAKLTMRRLLDDFAQWMQAEYAAERRSHQVA